jgi:hypothetical protein
VVMRLEVVPDDWKAPRDRQDQYHVSDPTHPYSRSLAFSLPSSLVATR